MKKAVLLLLLLAPYSNGQGTTENRASIARISIPGVKGVLELDVGPTTWEARVRSDGKETQLSAVHRSDGLLVTAFLQKVKFQASAEKCRAEWWPMTERATPLKREDLRKTDKDGIAIVEYIVRDFRGVPIRQKTIHAYLGSRDLCAEVHLSKVQFEPEDQRLFDGVVASLRLLPDESPVEGKSQAQKNQYGRGKSREQTTDEMIHQLIKARNKGEIVEVTLKDGAMKWGKAVDVSPTAFSLSLAGFSGTDVMRYDQVRFVRYESGWDRFKLQVIDLVTAPIVLSVFTIWAIQGHRC